MGRRFNSPGSPIETAKLETIKIMGELRLGYDMNSFDSGNAADLDLVAQMKKAQSGPYIK